MSRLISKVRRKYNSTKKLAKRKYNSAKQSFNSAFAEARRLGKKEFIYQGKRYGTKLKNEIENLGSTISSNLTSSTKSLPAMVKTYNKSFSAVPVVGNSNFPFLNQDQTYYFNLSHSPEGLFWGPGNENNPIQLGLITVTATKPRESTNINALSTKNKLGERYQGDKCAKWRNEALASMGYEIYGDAWTTPNFADKVYSGYDGVARPWRTTNKNLDDFNMQAARNFANNFSLDNLDPNEVYVVGTTYYDPIKKRPSGNRKTAFEEGVNGEANTHTGYAKFENGEWMFHSNIHGTEYVSPMKSMLGDTASMAITNIYKPRPRKNKLGGFIFKKLKTGGYFSNGLIIKGLQGLTVVPIKEQINPAWNINDILSEIKNNYNYYVNELGLTDNEYRSIAHALMGIGGVESEYGSGTRYKAKKLLPDFAVDMYHVAKDKPGLQSRGIYQLKIGEEWIGGTPQTQVQYQNAYSRAGMPSLIQASQQVASSPVYATRAALIRLADDAKILRSLPLYNKNGERVNLADALAFRWHYGGNNIKDSEINHDLYVTRARDYATKFLYK